jgi:hypothetical protein
MPRIKRVPLPDPFTVDVAVRHLYMALTNRGKGQLHHIALINPRMVDALSALWRREHPNAPGSSEHEHEEQVAGTLPGIGRWRLSRSSDGTGALAIEVQRTEEVHNSP